MMIAAIAPSVLARSFFATLVWMEVGHISGFASRICVALRQSIEAVGPRVGRKGFSSARTSPTYRGGQFSPLHEDGLVLGESLPDRHLSTVDFHKGVVQVAVSVYPIKHCLHLPPRLDVLFPALEDFRVRKFSHFNPP